MNKDKTKSKERNPLDEVLEHLEEMDEGLQPLDRNFLCECCAKKKDQESHEKHKKQE